MPPKPTVITRTTRSSTAAAAQVTPDDVDPLTAGDSNPVATDSHLVASTDDVGHVPAPSMPAATGGTTAPALDTAAVAARAPDEAEELHGGDAQTVAVLQAVLAQARAQTDAMVAVLQRRADTTASRPKPKSMIFHGASATLHDWLFAVEEDFHVMRYTTDADKLLFVVPLLAGPAFTWFKARAQAGHRPTTWDAFRAAVTERFQNPHFQMQIRAALGALRQGKASVLDFNERFQQMQVQAAGIDAESLLQHYFTGLNAEVRRFVRIQNPGDVFEAMRLAVATEDTLAEEISKNPAPAAASSAPQTPRAVAAFVTAAGAPRLSKLTPEERERLGKAGGCFRCRQLGHFAAACPMFPAGPRGPAENGRRR